MSTTTPNLTLTLYDSTTDQVVTFATFRAVWGGTATTSNFYRIDTWAGTVNSSISTLQTQRGAIPVSASFISANYYEATVASITAYTTNMSIILSVDTTSSGTVTLNINGLGTKSLMKVDSTGTPINLTGSDLVDGRQYLFTYDGTRWLWVSANSADQIQIVGTAGNIVTVGSTNNLDGSTTPSSLISSTTNSASAKTTPVGADKVGILDSADSFSLKSLLLSNLYKSLGTGTQDATTFLRGDGTYAIPTGFDWKIVSDSWTYASSNTINVPSGAASLYKKGMGVRFKQGGAYKYMSISNVADTLLTLTGGSDYTVANAAITDIYVTLVPTTAVGFPQEYNFDPNFTNLTLGNGTLTSKFSYVDGLIHGHIMVEFGSTTSIGGAVSFVLPVTISSYTVPSSSRNVIGTLGMLDSGTTVFLGNVILGGSSSSAQFRAQNNSGSGYAQIAALSSTVPMTWTTGDSIGAEFSYAP